MDKNVKSPAWWKLPFIKYFTIDRTYIVYSEDPLMAAEGIASKAIPELIEADKNSYSATYPTLTRWELCHFGQTSLIKNNVDPDQTAPDQGLHCLSFHLW